MSEPIAISLVEYRRWELDRLIEQIGAADARLLALCTAQIARMVLNGSKEAEENLKIVQAVEDLAIFDIYSLPHLRKLAKPNDFRDFYYCFTRLIDVAICVAMGLAVGRNSATAHSLQVVNEALAGLADDFASVEEDKALNSNNDDADLIYRDAYDTCLIELIRQAIGILYNQEWRFTCAPFVWLCYEPVWVMVWWDQTIERLNTTEPLRTCDVLEAYKACLGPMLQWDNRYHRYLLEMEALCRRSTLQTLQADPSTQSASTRS